ncbi:enoyl-CoA hydratase/isomerase [Streptomyces xiamenensis]|uniref:3-hydroxyisobutyryl-CoA hydrolase n=1 Tax=Streptomyces xiamenensis TaxID=408015 RepID=A0A0F7G128_9ACTN|nr:enoyl-CoA hydratase/isomerase family protein [Streptomyces xiamenensis]AKG46169.1 enoyl-CoA hydratase/isomerase [Streptomyces xiamenensis]
MDQLVEQEVSGGLGRLTLNRPAALNALTAEMVAAMAGALARWEDDPEVGGVLLRSASPRAFCAGGDVRAAREAVLAGTPEAADAFYAAEYALNGRIARFPKPYVSLIDGLVMGGGLGISVHGSVRVVTERAVFAMPETRIGFFPDVGASWFLPRLGLPLGRYLGLTGARLDAARALECGLATHFVPREELPGLEEALRTPADGVVATVERFARPAPPAGMEWAEQRELIGRCFADADPRRILERLAAEPGAWARETRRELAGFSPTSLWLTCELLERGAASEDLAVCLERELLLASRVARGADFAEGVRALLVDKDQRPRWRPERLDQVDVAGWTAGVPG